MLETYILKIDNSIEKDDFSKLVNYVSTEKQERIRRFHRFEDVQNTLFGEVMARYAICKRLGVRNSDLVLELNEYGKPILIEPSGIHFNISHSGNWVVCAVDDDPVGIDIEIIKPIDFKIAERFFSKDEYVSFINQSQEMRLLYFYKIWTLKESYIKAEGKGMSIPLNSFTISIRGNDIQVHVGNEIKNYSFYQSFLDSNIICGICATKINALNFNYIHFRRFIHEMRFMAQ